MICTLTVLFFLSLSFTLYMAHRVYKRRQWEGVEAIRQKRREEDDVDLMDYR